MIAPNANIMIEKRQNSCAINKKRKWKSEEIELLIQSIIYY